MADRGVIWRIGDKVSFEFDDEILEGYVETILPKDRVEIETEIGFIVRDSVDLTRIAEEWEKNDD